MHVLISKASLKESTGASVRAKSKIFFEMAQARRVEKESIVSELSAAVKELQRQYFQSGQTVTDHTSTAALQLCVQLDLALRDGLVKNHRETGFWKYAKLFSRKDIVQEIARLRSVRTDIGRGRAWIRIALNEASMEPFLNMFLDDPKHKKKFYMADAFLNDQEQGETVKMLLSGLDFLSFKMDFDVPLLDPMKKGIGGRVSLDQGGAAAVPRANINDTPRAVTTPNITKVQTPVRHTPSLPTSPGGAIDIAALIAAPTGDQDLLHKHVKKKKDGTKKKKKKKKSIEPVDDNRGSAANDGSLQVSDVVVPLPNTAQEQPAASSSISADLLSNASVFNALPVNDLADMFGVSSADDSTQPHKDESSENLPLFNSAPNAVVSSIPPQEAIEETWADKPSAREGIGPSLDLGSSIGTDWASQLDISENGAQLEGSHVDASDDTGASLDIPGFDALTKNQPELVFTSTTKLIVEPKEVALPDVEELSETDKVSDVQEDDLSQPGDQIALIETQSAPTEEIVDATPEIEVEVATDLVELLGADLELSDSPPLEDNEDANKIGIEDDSVLELGVDDADVIQRGTGCDIDVEDDNNLLLMLKLQIFTDDEEELIKLIRVSKVHGSFERAVHLLLTTQALYLLGPGEGSSVNTYTSRLSVPLHQVKSMKILNDGNVFCLNLRRARGDCSWNFISGDSDVSFKFYEALSRAVLDAGCDTLPTPTDGMEVWHQVVEQFVASEEGQSTEFEYWIGYRESSANSFRKVVIQSGIMELKESGFLSDSWKDQYFQLQGRTLGQLDSQHSRSVKMKCSIDDPSFQCKRVHDSEGRHCLEISNSNFNITVAAPSFDDAESWNRALNGDIPCVIGTSDSMSPLTKGSEWILSFIIQTPAAIYLCRGDLTGAKLHFSRSYAIESISALHAPLISRGYCQIDFDSEDQHADDSCRILFKTRCSMLKFGANVSKAWKNQFEVELQTHGF